MKRQLRVFFYLSFAAGLLSGLALTDPEAGRLQVIDQQGAIANVALSSAVQPALRPAFPANDKVIPN